MDSNFCTIFENLACSWVKSLTSGWGHWGHRKCWRGRTVNNGLTCHVDDTCWLSDYMRLVRIWGLTDGRPHGHMEPKSGSSSRFFRISGGFSKTSSSLRLLRFPPARTSIKTIFESCGPAYGHWSCWGRIIEVVLGFFRWCCYSWRPRKYIYIIFKIQYAWRFFAVIWP